MGIAADRLYLGEDLIFDSSTSEQHEVVDIFDRLTVGPDYAVLNSLAEGSAVTAAISPFGTFTVGGYAPMAVRDTGRSDSLVTLRLGVGPQLQLHPRVIDVNNWIGWMPSSGRLRLRVAGVSTDSTKVATAAESGDLIDMLTREDGAAIYRNGAILLVIDDPRFAAATRVGFGSGGASGSAAISTMRVSAAPKAPTLAGVDAQIDAATSVEDYAAALGPALAWAGASLQIHTTASGYFSGSLSLSDPSLRASAKAVARCLVRLPWRFRSGPQPWVLHIGADLRSGGSSASGLTVSDVDLYIAVPPTAAQYDTVTSDDAAARDHVLHHELGHLVHMRSSAPGASALSAAVTAANPPGFSYGGSAVGGPRPTGFCRGYGTQNVNEDIADVIGWLMTPALRDQLDTWCETDSYLATKVAAVRAFMHGLGWGTGYWS